MDDTNESAVVRRSSPAADDPAADSSNSGSSHEYNNIEKKVFDRLLDKRITEVVSDPAWFREKLHRHFDRLPLSYAMNIDVHKAEDVFLHHWILHDGADPDKQPVCHARLLHSIQIHDPEPEVDDSPWGFHRHVEMLHLHEIIFSTVDRPKLLSRLSALLSQVGLNIREAHVFTTTDGFGLYIFIVDGWDTEEIDVLLQCLKETAANVLLQCLKETAARNHIR